MPQNVSAFGFVVSLIASTTFPTGFVITQFSDDADPFDVPTLVIADKAMGLNGDLVVWSRAMAIDCTINVIADSQDDINLAILLDANRVGRGKQSAQDSITLTGVYPSGNTKSFTSGVIISGSPASSVATAGRLKSKAYVFAFEGANGVGT
jgi:hypothetical protein